ncbi:uncharacterized protein FIESC28_10981 [Fusarium coffeatum]|uniref:Uncharacterized protein n=1 Tax=Fusarium coffeatum TaxID=231269 RepID=A0A366QR23_9HYPO|nr:uncharacterized protein FIESC28_10981 [Fusarium coffeatum]RBR06586.1 hypothetical protein FIESC28_10981 [Fusarium coffeatum]
MPSYSSEEFYADWRHSVKEDFVTSSDQPYPYADNGHRQWSNELHKFTFDEMAHRGTVSNGGKHLALAVKNDIHVVDTETWGTIAVLKGHTSEVHAVAFRPDDSNVLVSSEADYNRSNIMTYPLIIFWNIEEERAKHPNDDDSYADAAQAAASTAAKKLTNHGVDLTDEELRSLEEDLQPVIDRAAARHIAKRHVTIDGRLQASFQAQIFSPSGKWMIYLPGRAPGSNRDDPWDMQIISTDTLEKKFLLQGHTDSIMWTGWSPDESLFASISWDTTIRIWDAHTGDQKHCFTTETQNWTGGFSSDMNYFAATNGQGHVRIFSLPSGELHWMYEGQKGNGWRRSVDWHPNNQWLVVGGERLGEIFILDVIEKRRTQKRVLSTDDCTRDEVYRDMMKRMLVAQKVQFFDGGNKLAVCTQGDSSIEVYDIKQEVKWRFPRGGTDDGPEAEKWRGENGKVTSKGGRGMVAWEDRSKDVLRMASLDFDGVRIWEVPLTV